MKKENEKASPTRPSETSLATDEEMKMTTWQLAEKLSQNASFDIEAGQKLVIQNIDLNDFLTAAGSTEPAIQLQMLQRMMNRFSLEINLEGSINLGQFNLADNSWTILPGNTGSLRIVSKPLALRRSLSELVAFLNMLPVGQALMFKPRQDLLIDGLSPDSMLEYYQFCQDNKDPKEQEKGQDELFAKASSTLALKGLNLRIYALNAVQIDRGIDVNAKGIVFKALGNSELTAPTLVAVLLAKGEA